MNEELLSYKNKFEGELKSILSYWMKYSVEEDGDGFYGAVDINNNPVLKANKSCVLNTRILWTFSAAAIIYGDESYAKMADKAFKVITENFADKEYGGFYMELTPDNRVHNSIKHTYAQAFAVYSLCKYYELKTDKKILEYIIKCFDLFETKTKDLSYPGYKEAFTREWKLIEENRMADNNEPKSMNTHLHVLEAYSALYKVWKDELVKTRLKELLLLFINKIIRNDGHLGIFFDNNFNEVESSKGICSFGHDIEASWLLVEAAEILGDAEILSLMNSISVKMAEAVEKTGLDKSGGMFLESSRYGSHIRTNKHWWIQAETLVGFMNAFEISGNKRYWDNVIQTWNFIDRFVIDHEKGEWFTKVNRLGEPFLVESEDDPSPYYRNDWKIDPWKCPYHNGRACMELIRRINNLTLQD